MVMTASEIDAYVGRRMRQRREALEISQGLLGRQIGLTFSQVQKYEKGTNRIGAGRLFLLAMFLDVPIQYFFEGLGEAPASRVANGRPDVSGAELAVLDDAFLSIADSETRRSLVALVCSLAGGADHAERRRQRAG
jgi:transcriptional regulator with XRE-family HTH domain